MEIAFRKINKTLVVSVSGEIDHHSAAGIGYEADKKFSMSGATNMVIDLSRLQFMDSSGLGVIIGRYKNVTALGGKTGLVVSNDRIKKLINLSGLNKIISVCGSVDAAVKGM